jgi:predicted MFS family arabinose efflux permease
MTVAPARRQLVEGQGLPRGMVTLFAVAAGLAVANIYYAQPLLTSIAAEFHTGSGTAALIVTATTVGYAIGLATVVPLGDVVSRRRLVVTLLVLVAIGQAGCAVMPSIGLLVVASFAVAVCAVVAPLLVSFAAALANPGERGRATGTVMSGVLLGLLLARTGGGVVAQWGGGWRTVYAVAAVVMLALAVVLHRALPDVAVASKLRYLSLLRSAVVIVREEPLLRLRCAYGFLSFAGFSAFWVSSAFLLAGAPYGYGSALIGTFGLVGAVGAYAAKAIGPVSDRGRDNLVTGVLLSVILLAWGALALNGGHWLIALLVGVVLLDLGVQGVQVMNLGVVYRLRPEARNRITMAYTSTYFLGGVAGSAASGAAYAAAGWPAVCAVGGGFALLALLLLVAESTVRRLRVAGQRNP